MILDHISWLIIWYIIFVLAVTLIVHRKVNNRWRALTKEKNFKERSYKGETFRSPLNLGVAMLAILIPIACGLLCYEISKSPTSVVDLLVVSIFCMFSSMIWGGYQSYAIATQCTDDDRFKITRDRNWKIPADFAAQLVLLALGIIGIMAFLILCFRPATNMGTKSSLESDSSLVLLRPKPKLGTSTEEMVKLWGEAEAVKEIRPDLMTYMYLSPSSEYTLLFEEKKLVKIVERMKKKQREVVHD